MVNEVVVDDDDDDDDETGKRSWTTCRDRNPNNVNAKPLYYRGFDRAAGRGGGSDEGKRTDLEITERISAKPVDVVFVVVVVVAVVSLLAESTTTGAGAGAGASITEGDRKHRRCHH